jgi:predicted HicB family RNase H-like nuclease
MEATVERPSGRLEGRRSVNIKIDSELHRRARVAALYRGLTLQDLVSVALQDLLEAEGERSA